jgi:predicted PurR-regulated permease PerM
MTVSLLVLVLVLVLVFNETLGFTSKLVNRKISSSSSSLIINRNRLITTSSSSLKAGLDADTLSALGDLQELNQALDGAVDGALEQAQNPALSVLTKLVDSPAILAVPIGAGLLVAFGISFFIFSYGQGKE